MGSTSSCCNSASGTGSIEDVLAREEQIAAVGGPPSPSDLGSEPAMPQLWKVVGGAGKGGIFVRDSEDPASACRSCLDEDGDEMVHKLDTGAVVEEQTLTELGRLSYKLVSGDGPLTGWVSVKQNSKDLLVKIDAEPSPAVSGIDESPAALTAISSEQPEVFNRADSSISSIKSCLSRADSKPSSSPFGKKKIYRKSVSLGSFGSFDSAVTVEVLEIPNLSKEAACNFDNVMSEREAAAAKNIKRSSAEIHLSYDCRTSKEGSMWKLNHDVDPDDRAKLSDIMNWRRRDFIFQLNKNTGECALLYFSEKVNSTAQTFSPVRDGCSNKLAQVAALDMPVKLVMDDNKRREVATKIMNYDTAMSGDDRSMARHRKIENYLEKIPEPVMHVLVVKYKNKDDTMNKKLLGFYSAKDLQQWTRQFQNPQLATKKKGTLKQIKRFFGMV